MPNNNTPPFKKPNGVFSFPRNTRNLPKFSRHILQTWKKILSKSRYNNMPNSFLHMRKYPKSHEALSLDNHHRLLSLANQSRLPSPSRPSSRNITLVSNDLRFFSKIAALQNLSKYSCKVLLYKPKDEWFYFRPSKYFMVNDQVKLGLRIFKYLRMHKGIRTFKWETSQWKFMFKDYSKVVLDYLQTCPNLCSLRVVDLPKEDYPRKHEVKMSSMIDLRVIHSQLMYLEWSGFAGELDSANGILKNLKYLTNLIEMKIAMHINPCLGDSIYKYDDIFKECEYENLLKLKKFWLEFYDYGFDTRGVYNLKRFTFSIFVLYFFFLCISFLSFSSRLLMSPLPSLPSLSSSTISKIPNLEDFYLSTYSTRTDITNKDTRILLTFIQDLKDFPRSLLKSLRLNIAIMNFQNEQNPLEIPWDDLPFLEDLAMDIEIKESPYEPSPLVFIRRLQRLLSLKTLKIKLKCHRQKQENWDELVTYDNLEMEELENPMGVLDEKPCEGIILEKVEEGIMRGRMEEEDQQESLSSQIKSLNNHLEQSNTQQEDNTHSFKLFEENQDEDFLWIEEKTDGVDELNLKEDEKLRNFHIETRPKTPFGIFKTLTNMINLSLLDLELINIEVDESEFVYLGDILNNLVMLTRIKLIFLEVEISRLGAEQFFRSLASLKYARMLNLGFFKCERVLMDMVEVLKNIWGQKKSNLMENLHNLDLNFGITYLNGDELLLLGDALRFFSNLRSLELHFNTYELSIEQRIKFSKKLNRLRNLKFVKCSFDEEFDLEQRKKFEIEGFNHEKLRWRNLIVGYIPLNSGCKLFYP